MLARSTSYGGLAFRSRVHARWAAFFDVLGWRWEYEPLHYDGPHPTFVLFLKRPLYVGVVRGVYESDRLVGLTVAAKSSHWPSVLAVGNAPLPCDLWRYRSLPCCQVGRIVCDGGGGAADDPDVAVLQRCGGCGEPSLFCHYGSWACLRCGAHDGDRLNQPIWFDEATRLWRAACNAVFAENLE